MPEDDARRVERVRVAVRVRPRNRREEALENKLNHAVEVDEASGQVLVSKRKHERPGLSVSSAGNSESTADRELRSTYDRVFGVNASQDDVFEYLRESVQQVAQGFNCTIFAYGQTGTGKTHTMLGKDLEKSLDSAMSASGTSASIPRDCWGVIPRSIESLFEELESIARHGAAAAIVYCSYMQIYNNEVYDLLQENRVRMKEPLAVREMIKGNDKHIYVSGLSEFRVTNLDETLRLLRQGNKNRTIRATEYNEKSSRSHALLQLSAEVESRGVEGPTTIIRRAKLNLVDLAGSEKWDTDVAMGSDRCKELTSINQSLSALGNVISALANPRRSHVPYRDSKLTRLLQDSLGGNTRTTVIATISQDESAVEETISTLLFADRAKCVTLRVKANEVVDDAVLLAQARREIARLRLLVKKNASQEQINELEVKIAKLTRENAALVSENKKLKQALTLSKRVRATEAAPSHSGVRDLVDIVTPATSERVGQVMTPVESSVNQRAQPPLLDLERTITPNPRKSENRSDDVDMSDGVGQVLEVERDHKKLLEHIQSERRALEQELERIEQLQSPRQPQSGVDNDSEELCPMCRRVIDEHTDGELDECIEKETAALQRSKRPASPSMEPSKHDIALPRKVQSQHDRQTYKKPKSPYLQQVFLKPQPPHGSTSQLTAQRRSVRDFSPPHGSSISSARDVTELRPSTADTLSKSNNNALDDDATHPLHAPIVRQGSKSVKALKKFQAMSPYSRPSIKKAPSKATSRPVPAPDNNSNASGGGAEDCITCSLQDIGLSLLIYKFRYDCWYPCTVVGYDSKRRLHCCQYEYGDKQWQELSQNKVQVVRRRGGDDSSQVA